MEVLKLLHGFIINIRKDKQLINKLGIFPIGKPYDFVKIWRKKLN